MYCLEKHKGGMAMVNIENFIRNKQIKIIYKSYSHQSRIYLLDL